MLSRGVGIFLGVLEMTEYDSIFLLISSQARETIYGSCAKL